MGLGCEPDGRIDRSIASVAPPLHNLEEETTLQGLRIGLEILGLTFPIVQNVVGSKPLDIVGGEVRSDFEIVIIVLGNRQEIDPVFFQALHGRQDVARGKGDVLDSGSEKLVQKARGQGALALGCIEDQPE